MNTPKELKYTKSHEWVQETGPATVRIGLTDYAQTELGDIVFVNLPQQGDAVTTGDVFADVESVKAVSDVYSPASGTVSAVNSILLDAPEEVNQDAYSAWFIEIENASDFEELLTAEEYEKFCEEQ